MMKFDRKRAKGGEEAGEGSGVAIIYRKDPLFESLYPDGVDDMVMMQELNDAELANNLKVRSTACGERCVGVRSVFGCQIKFKKNLGYVRCGPTLVALNLMANYTGTNSVSLCLPQYACSTLHAHVSLPLCPYHCASDSWWVL